MSDLISRQDAIDAAIEAVDEWDGGYSPTRADMIADAINNTVPSEQPEVIRCKDCKYSDENWRRVSVRWLPCMDIRVPSNWFCGSAERREDE